jgi:GNAT superfamily N-acetyltransferase
MPARPQRDQLEPQTTNPFEGATSVAIRVEPVRTALGSQAGSEPVRLRDGSQVVIRQIREVDAALPADVFAGLSPQSRMRLLLGNDALFVARLRSLTELDHHDREAIGALSLAQGRGVGIARYARDAQDPGAAHVAVTVVDEWQRRGLCGPLLSRLAARAREEGIVRFIADVSTDDVEMLALLRALPAEVTITGREFGIVRYSVSLIRHRCDLCGKAADWVPGEPRPRRICEVCIRTYVPKIQARLADPWWR